MEKYLNYLGYSEFGGGGSRILNLRENHPGVNSMKLVILFGWSSLSDSKEAELLFCYQGGNAGNNSRPLGDGGFFAFRRIFWSVASDW